MKKFILLTFLFIPFVLQAESVSDIQIVPNLDISRFSSYKIRANVSGSPESVSVSIVGINGDGDDHWNYYASSTPYNDTVIKSMSASSTYYESQNIYPDSIYPEIFFAPSSITWNNLPSNIDLRRNKYYLLHFQNPYTMTASSSFFIEFNALPNSSVNSASLEVYLVEKNKDISFFNSDWRNNSSVELVGSFDKNSDFHHTHTANSSHKLVALNTNANGKIGLKNLDIEDDFWIILYSNSPNNNRGWTLRYQGSALCTNNNGWYSGNQTGWTTTLQTGCPDSHIHMARRDPIYSDGITALVTATYEGGGVATSSDTFMFYELPNLAPNQTSFVVPVTNAIYDGNPDDILNIEWNPATDPNENSVLDYSIYLLDSGGATSTLLVSATTSTSFDWDISEIANGSYGLRGIVCDNDSSPLCTSFDLPGNFLIEKVDPIYSLSSISISSNNATPSLAYTGDTVTVSFTATGALSATTSVEFYSGGDLVANTPSISNVSGNNWQASYVVDQADTIGPVSFIITANNLDYEYFYTIDDSNVSIIEYTPTPEAEVEPQSSNTTSGTTIQGRVNNLISIGRIEEALNLKKQYSHLFDDTSGNLISTNFTVLNRDLKYKMIDDEVRLLQKFLNANGYIVSVLGPGSPGQETNIFGEKTRLSLIRFQEANGIVPSSGFFGPITRSVVNNILVGKDLELPPVEVVSPQSTFERNLKLGMSGEDVKNLQLFLISQNIGSASRALNQNGATFYFGNLTQQALIEFQKYYGITPAIGFFGPITRKFINQRLNTNST